MRRSLAVLGRGDAKDAHSPVERSNLAKAELPKDRVKRIPVDFLRKLEIPNLANSSHFCVLHRVCINHPQKEYILGA